MVYASTHHPEFSYGEDYFAGAGKRTGYADYAGEIDSHRATFTRRLKDAERRLGARGRLLDVGCAFGHFAVTAQERGWDVCATDISPVAAVHARRHIGARVFVSDPNRAAVAPASMDLVTLYDVIEHVANPRALLAEILPLLRRSGWLHVTTPDVASVSAKLLGRHWYHYKPREHCLYFSPATLSRVLNDSGFDVVSVTPAPSRMSIDSVLSRLQRYAPAVSSLTRGAARAVGVSHAVVTVPIGELQAWARPRGTG
jgi:2-polyprenyl-3-methyl-5-hydroxy-6-metoxy-1,4-benzoquinol methylase